jgi:hypothetical protein
MQEVKPYEAAMKKQTANKSAENKTQPPVNLAYNMEA